ncbi:MAG: NCS2 family permease [Chlamydiota bacterium]|nr:NCS2 family permease [Chlamydiota bacterium]
MINEFLNDHFELEKKNTSAKSELIAALSTFATMSYIIIVNPKILSSAGMDFPAVMTATILVTAFATMLMGVLGKYPFVLGPSMGLNGYFAYSLVLGDGYSWEMALAGAFIASIVLMLLNMLGVRQLIMDKLPHGVRFGTIGGIGILLAFIGLKGVNIIVDDSQTLLKIGEISSAESLLTFFGVFLISVLIRFKFKPAIIFTIILLWSLGLALGLTSWHGVLSLPPSLSPTFLKLDFSNTISGSMLSIVITFVFVMIFDAAGTLLALCDQVDHIDIKKRIPRLKKLLFCDAAGTAIGALLGCTPLANYLESGAGISAGGKTGLTAIFVSLFFLLCLFFSPLASSIPMFAVSPALIVIGATMAKTFTKVSFKDTYEYIPAFLTMVTIPLTFNIPDGIGLGLTAAVILKALSSGVKAIHWIIWLIVTLFIFKFFLSMGYHRL